MFVPTCYVVYNRLAQVRSVVPCLLYTSIANYVATVANGGTNYKAHLLKAVKSNSNAEIVEETKPEIRHQIDIKQENLNAVLKGMGMVTSEGTAKSIFADFPVKTGGKTGSAQVSRGSAN